MPANSGRENKPMVQLDLRKRRNTATGWSFAPKGASCFCPLRIFGGLAPKKIMSKSALAETKLDPDVFLRIHRSAIVNLQHVKEFRTDGNDGECFVTMSDGHKLPVSRGYRSRITSLIAR
jgi:hypothetical protein